VRAHAWQATASWVLPGEGAGPGGVRPMNGFDPSRGLWGALELAARANGFALDDDAFANGLFDETRSARDAFAWAVGLNWHLNRHVKQVLDYERTSFTGGAAAGADRANENALFFRTQLSF
jgi:phosphate-selective porin OprO/OprP